MQSKVRSWCQNESRGKLHSCLVPHLPAIPLPLLHSKLLVGWGKVITPPDYWRPVNGSKLTLWNWHAVFADQGLLYFWAKYVKRNVSIIIGSEIEHWTTTIGSTNEKAEDVTLQRIDGNSPLDMYSCVSTKSSYQKDRRQPPAPYRDFYHFTGNRKPWEFMDWQYPLHVNTSTVMSTGKQGFQRMQIWRDTLMKVQEMTNYNFTLLGSSSSNNNNNHTNTVPEHSVRSISTPPMGRFSTYQAMISHIKAKRFFGWNQYEEI
jgi:hypothetical protein